MGSSTYQMYENASNRLKYHFVRNIYMYQANWEHFDIKSVNCKPTFIHLLQIFGEFCKSLIVVNISCCGPVFLPYSCYKQFKNRCELGLIGKWVTANQFISEIAK